MIPVFKPYTHESVMKELQEVLDSGWLGLGPKVAELEKQLAMMVGARHFIATSSCTAALELAYWIFGITAPYGVKPGILVPPVTFASTASAAAMRGLRVVFGDVDKDGMLKCPSMADAVRHSITKAVIVHLAGARCEETNRILAAFDPENVIEDCAHAFGAPWLGKPCGVMRCWSFHAVKNLPMGEGGGVSTNDPTIAELLRKARWLGIDKTTADRSSALGYSPEYDIKRMGFKAHMHDVTAAIGLGNLRGFHEAQYKRRSICLQYAKGLKEFAPLYTPNESACHYYPLRFRDQAQRDSVRGALQKHGSASSIHYRPLFEFEAFEEMQKLGTIAALEYHDTVLTLPVFPDLSEDVVDAIIKVVRGVVSY